MVVDLVALHAANPKRYPYLLESVATPEISEAIYGEGESEEREESWNILFAFPGETISSDSDDFLTSLDVGWREAAASLTSTVSPTTNSSIPFYGGWFLFLDYELAREIEPNSKLTSATTSKYNSSSYATRIPSAIIQNRATGKIELVDEAADKIRLQKMQQDLDSLEVNLATGNEKIVRGEIAEEPAESYLKSIDQIKKYIVEGDLFQANLSRQWQAKLDKGASPHIIYQKLRESNPAPFAGLALYNGTAIISSSPERLVRVKNRVAESRPIAGTHPRSADKREDRELANRLLAHPKEQAEHIMLIDLVRNDLGRVCKTGTVEVNEKMGLESYTHVHHIVSNIRGELRDEVTPAEVIRALFPGGTITGCPKVRCMEIIAELEQQPRGAYTGSFGYLNHNGDMDLNILIRTLTMSLSTVAPSTITLRAGAGIVYDSIPEKELAESRAKAKGVLLALKSISLQEVVW